VTRCLIAKKGIVVGDPGKAKWGACGRERNEVLALVRVGRLSAKRISH